MSRCRTYNLKHTKDILEPIVKESFSIAAVLRKLGLKQCGGSQSHIKSRIRFFGIDTSHFKGQGIMLGVSPTNKIPWQEILVKRTDGIKTNVSKLRRALIESGREYKCEECDAPPKWNGKPLCIQIDHKDGDTSNNTSKNLRFLCPNCHSQTDTFGAKNIAIVVERQTQ